MMEFISWESTVISNHGITVAQGSKTEAYEELCVDVDTILKKAAEIFVTPDTKFETYNVDNAAGVLKYDVGDDSVYIFRFKNNLLQFQCKLNLEYPVNSLKLLGTSLYFASSLGLYHLTLLEVLNDTDCSQESVYKKPSLIYSSDKILSFTLSDDGCILAVNPDKNTIELIIINSCHELQTLTTLETNKYSCNITVESLAVFCVSIKPDVPESSKPVLQIPRHQFSQLFGAELTLAQSQIIIIGFPSGLVYWLPIGCSKVLPSILCHIKQPMVNLFNLEIGSTSALLFIGKYGRVVSWISTTDDPGSPEMFSQSYISSPVSEAIIYNNSIFHLSGEELWYSEVGFCGKENKLVIHSKPCPLYNVFSINIIHSDTKSSILFGSLDGHLLSTEVDNLISVSLKRNVGQSLERLYHYIYEGADRMKSAQFEISSLNSQLAALNLASQIKLSVIPVSTSCTITCIQNLEGCSTISVQFVGLKNLNLKFPWWNCAVCVQSENGVIVTKSLSACADDLGCVTVIIEVPFHGCLHIFTGIHLILPDADPLYVPLEDHYCFLPFPKEVALDILTEFSLKKPAVNLFEKEELLKFSNLKAVKGLKVASLSLFSKAVKEILKPSLLPGSKDLTEGMQIWMNRCIGSSLCTVKSDNDITILDISTDSAKCLLSLKEFVLSCFMSALEKSEAGNGQKAVITKECLASVQELKQELDSLLLNEDAWSSKAVMLFFKDWRDNVTAKLPVL